MKPTGKNISLTSYDDIFSTEQIRAENQRDQVQQIPIRELYPFKDHPFRVLDDDRMKETVESVKEYGVLVPLIARPIEDGCYEIVSGHRRKRACELAGLEEVPVIVRDIDDDEAVIIMVDSNLQRENILPSERAKAYQMKLEALKHRAGRPSKENSSQIATNYRADEVVGAEAGMSKDSVRRFIRLNNLEQPLMDMVDNKQLGFTPAVELSFLKPEEQQALVTALEVTQAAPSLSQAQRIKKLSQEGNATTENLTAIMREDKKPLVESVTLSHDTLRKYFPKSYTAKDMEKIILKLLDKWMRSRQQSQER